MARKVFSSSRKCSGHRSVRSSTGFSSAGISETDRDRSEGVADGCLPTSASRVEFAEAVAERACRPRFCLWATGGGVVGMGARSVIAARGGEDGGGIDVVAGAGVGAGAGAGVLLSDPPFEGRAAGLDGGETIWNPASSSSSSDLIWIISTSSFTATAGPSERRDRVGDARSESSWSASSSDLASCATFLADVRPFVRTGRGRLEHEGTL